MKEIENPLDSLHGSMTGHSRDMSLDRRDAWAYGVIVGWGDEDNPADNGTFEELQARHGWSDEAIARLKRLHAVYLQAKARLEPGYVDPMELALNKYRAMVVAIMDNPNLPQALRLVVSSVSDKIEAGLTK